MAAKVARFGFADESYFYCELDNHEFSVLMGANANWQAQGIAGEHASKLGLQVSSMLSKVTVGGHTAGKDVGVLYNKLGNGNSAAGTAVTGPAASPTVGASQTVTASPTSGSRTMVASPTASTSGQTGEGVFWPHNAVLLLIETFKEERHLFGDPSVKKNRGVATYRKAPGGGGYTFTADSCDKKWRNLKNRFKVITDSQRQSGAGRRQWQYMKAMASALDKDPAVIPKVIVSCLDKVQPSQPDGKSPSATNSLPTMSAAPQSSPVKAKNVGPVNQQRRRKLKYDEPPVWFRNYVEKTDEKMSQLISLVKEKTRQNQERNDILRDLASSLR